MKYNFYCPTRFEVPSRFRNKTKVFGMGQKRAEALATELNLLPEDEVPVVFGSAGSLRTYLKPGKYFQISRIKEQNLPQHLKFDGVSLASGSKILKTPKEKKDFQSDTKADLVDLEMEFIWNKLTDRLKNRVIFVRTVIDGAEDDISFLCNEGVNWKMLIAPRQLFNFLKFVYHYQKYLSGMSEALEKIG